MSFESFIENIETLVVLPTLEKSENGYAYDSDLFGTVYRHGDKLLIVSESAVDEIQIPLVEAIYKSIEEGVGSDVREALASYVDMTATDVKIDTMNGDLLTLQEKLTIIQDTITIQSNNNETIVSDINELKNNKPEISLELIQKIVDKKLNDAPARVGKIKISTLSMLKESGFSIEEISELAKNELI